jgi:hypothetical protein
MSTTLVVVIVIIAVGLAAASAVAMRPRPTTTSGRPWRGIELGPEVLDFVTAFYSAPNEEDPRFTRALTNLRTGAAGSAQQIAQSYDKLDQAYLGQRRSLLYAARYLGDEAALPFLIRVAMQERQGESAHEGGRLAEESMLRSIAVEGIEQIAMHGSREAFDALLPFVRSTDRLVQATAVVALKYLNCPIERLRSLVSEDRSYLLEIARIDIRDVPQIKDPRRHLRAEWTGATVRPGPEVAAAAGARTAIGRSRTPNVRSGTQNG